ncbi:MAG: hypothetical protein IPK63_14320 [Candidatus Competibacteraceae bacterium]|nr:hypothetical protein [Candidatus Competibacteraceae bacterium]
MALALRLTDGAAVSLHWGSWRVVCWSDVGPGWFSCRRWSGALIGCTRWTYPLALLEIALCQPHRALCARSPTEYFN